MSDQELLPESKELIAVEKLDAVTVFTKGGLDTVLADVEKLARSIVTDPTTKKGRDDIRSLAHKITKSRTGLFKVATKLTEDWRDQTKIVNAERTRMEEVLQALEDEIRKPLTDFENAEKERKAEHESMLAVITALGAFDHHATSEQIKERLDHLEKIPARDWEEYFDRAAVEIAKVASSLNDRYGRVKKTEEDQAELEKLRKEKAARDQKDHEDRIASEAAAKAKAETEAAAKIEQDRIQREKDDAERRAKEEAERAQEAEYREMAAIAGGYVDRIKAEEKAKADSEAAAQRERDRIAAEQRIKDEEEKKRQEDIQHKKKINNESKAAILSVLTAETDIEDAAEAVIVAIHSGKIPHVKISY